MKRLFILFVILSTLNCFATDKADKFNINTDGVLSWDIVSEDKTTTYIFKPDKEFVLSILKDAGSAYGELFKKDPIAPEAFKVNEYKAFLSWATDKESLASPDESVANRGLLNFEFTNEANKTTFYHVSVHDPKLATGFEEILPAGEKIEEENTDNEDLSAFDLEIAELTGEAKVGDEKGKEAASSRGGARFSFAGAKAQQSSSEHDFDTELQEAIALSILEQRSGGAAAAGGEAANYLEDAEDYDKDLEAAIRASLGK